MFAMCAVIAGVSLSALAGDRAAVPDAKALDSAARIVDQTFRLGAVGKDPVRQLAAARKLAEAATTGRDPLSVRYVEFCRARDLAARVDLQTAMRVCDQLVTMFDLDAGQERLDLLSRSAARLTTPAVETVITWSDEALADGRPDQARRLADAAVFMATTLRHPLVANDAREQLLRVTNAAREDRAMAGLRSRVNANPKDIGSRLQLGRLLCVEQDKWAEGVPLLQHDADPRVRAAVQLDMGNPSTPESILAAGDAWWDLAQSDRTFPPAASRRRAAMWYERAVPQLDGLSKARAEGRLEEAAARGDSAAQLGGPGKWITLSLTGTKWGLAPHPMVIERRGAALVIRNPDAGPLYLVNERIIPTDFTIAVTVKGRCVIGLLSADRVDHSLYTVSPDDGSWHEVQLRRERQGLSSAEDGAVTEVKSYNAPTAMTGVIGIQINAKQAIELRSISLR